MCQDGEGLPRFQIKPDVNQTMEQMMAALMGRVPRGTGQGGVGGAGSGSGGSGGDGFSVAGQSTNVPMYGPDRLNFSAASGASGRDGRSGRTGPRDASERATSRVDPETHRNTTNAKILPDTIPAKYRDAVKRYFTPDAENPPQN